MAKRIRILPLPPGLPEPSPLKAIRGIVGLPEVYIEVPEEINLELKSVNVVGGVPPQIVFKFDRKDN